MSSIGTALVTPSYGIAGEYGTWTVVFEAGSAGIALGGGIRVQLPDSWHVGECHTAKPVQSSAPEQPNCVSGRCSREEVMTDVVVESGTTEPTKANRRGLDGRAGRYVFVVHAVVRDVPLQAGDRVEITYGDRSMGSPGFEASRWVDGPEAVRVAVDTTGDGTYRRLPDHDCPVIEVRSGPPAELVLTAPSMLRVDEEADLHVALLDEHGNRCTDADSAVALSGPSTFDVEQTVTFLPGNAGIARVPIRSHAHGVVRVRGTSTSGLEAVSNPIMCGDHEPETSIYWGDLHSHAAHSFDAVGRDPFGYARDVACLDFYALTDHCERWPDGAWDWLRSEVERWYEPGRFATLLGYEATFVGPWGHHNVYLRDLDGPVLGDNSGTLLDLWQALRDRTALTVPHHTGVRFAGAKGNVPGGEAPNPDWRYHDARLRRLIEIYSGHGQSESYAPDHPLSYENAGFDTSTSADGAFYASDAWLLGHELGVIASSDDHHAQPGRGEFGLAAVRATSLTREDVFDALAARRTYGTTGARILIDFAVDGAPMGSRVRWNARPVRISLRAHGTDVIEEVELLAGDLTSREFRVVERWKPDKPDFIGELVDERPPVPGLYYVRLRQANAYRGRVPMAWSSPVWLAAAVDQ